MKKILLATTLLAASTGFAAAEITWGGSASAGIAANGTANGGGINTAYAGDGITVLADDAMHSYSSVKLAVTFSGSTDSGLTFGATFDTSAGRSYTLGDGDAFANEGGSFGMPTVFVEGTFGKLAFSSDNMDFYDDTNANADVEYTGTFGAVSVGLRADVDTNNASAKIGYTAGAVSVNANIDTYDLWNLDGTYTMGSLAVTGATDESQNSSLKAAYSANGISASAKYNTNGGTVGAVGSIDVAVGYSANALSLKASVDNIGEADTNGNALADDVAKWTVTAGYDLGGGLSVEAGTNYTQDMMLGAKMSF